MIHISLHRNERDIVIETPPLKGQDFTRFSKICRAFGTQRQGRAGILPLSSTLDFTRALRAKNYKVNVDTNVKTCFYAESGIFPETVHNIKNSSLFTYQKEDAILLASKNRWLLSNQMGTGKTCTTLMALPPAYACKALVICPASIKSVWYDECQKWRSDFHVEMISGKANWRLPKVGEMIIANYEIMPNNTRFDWEGEFEKTKSFPEDCFGFHLIADEAHYLKNSRAKRTKMFRELVRANTKRHGYVWLLSGTPMMNNPIELWNVLMAAKLEGDAFGSWPKFIKLFGGWQNEWNAWKWGKTHPSVPNLLAQVSSRRTRKEVLPDLPGKFYRTTTVSIDKKTKTLCDRFMTSIKSAGVDFEEAIEDAIANRDARIDFTELSEARRELATAKIPHMLSAVETFEEGEESVVVFSAHEDPIKVLGERKGWRIITGSTRDEDRTEAVREFQDGKLKGLAATIKAGGVGLTLTYAHQAIFVDMDWTPANNLQAEDRLCRIGQTKGVVINRIVADHVLDDRLTTILVAKKKLLEASSLA